MTSVLRIIGIFLGALSIFSLAFDAYNFGISTLFVNLLTYFKAFIEVATAPIKLVVEYIERVFAINASLSFVWKEAAVLLGAFFASISRASSVDGFSIFLRTLLGFSVIVITCLNGIPEYLNPTFWPYLMGFEPVRGINPIRASVVWAPVIFMVACVLLAFLYEPERKNLNFNLLILVCAVANYVAFVLFGFASDRSPLEELRGGIPSEAIGMYAAAVIFVSAACYASSQFVAATKDGTGSVYLRRVSAELLIVPAAALFFFLTNAGLSRFGL